MQEVFTRPQRILCLFVLLTGVFAINAAIFGSPDQLIGSDQCLGRSVLCPVWMRLHEYVLVGDGGLELSYANYSARHLGPRRTDVIR